MSDIKDRLAEKARRAEELRTEIATLQYVAQESNAEADLVLQEQALDEELERLAAQKRSATIAAGGSVAEALKAMEDQAATNASLAAARPALGSVVPTSNTESAKSDEKE